MENPERTECDILLGARLVRELGQAADSQAKKVPDAVVTVLDS